LKGKSYDVPAGDGGAPGQLGAVAATATVEISDLTKFPGPQDKAKILLETAAEVEHALLMPYLYAAFCVRSEDEDPAKQAALSELFCEVHRIARQEMGRLMTVQNLLLGIGLPPTSNAGTSRRAKTSTRFSCISGSTSGVLSNPTRSIQTNAVSARSTYSEKMPGTIRVLHYPRQCRSTATTMCSY
jgi:hypothetical protein